MQKKKVIYVDSVSLNLTVVPFKLKNYYDVLTAQSVIELCKLLDTENPDLILLDLDMEGGFDVLERIKTDSRSANVPAIFLTFDKTREGVMKAQGSCVVDFILKPASEEDLVRHLEYQLNPEARKVNKPVVLAVDDNPSILQAINELLSGEYEVATLTNPEKIRQVMEGVKPDLILLDYQMPIYTGFDLIPIIREVEGHKDTPIVFLTSEGTMDHVTIATRLGACDFMVKPINENILREKMVTCLKEYMFRRHLRDCK